MVFVLCNGSCVHAHICTGGNRRSATYITDASSSLGAARSAGKYKSSTDVACVQCPVDTYSTHVAATGIATCAVCPALTTSVVGASAKTQCVSQIGTFSAGPGEAAEYCSPGKYQNEPDKTHCESCGVGKYQPLYGATSTAQCLD